MCSSLAVAAAQLVVQIDSLLHVSTTNKAVSGFCARLLAKKSSMLARVFFQIRSHPSSQTLRSTPEGSGWIYLEHVGQTGQANAGRGLCLCRCAGEKSIAARPRKAAPASQTPQRVQRNASNTNAQQHQKHQTTKCRPAATRTGVQRRRRATPSRRRLHVIGRASSPGLHKLRGRPPRRRSRRSRQRGK